MSKKGWHLNALNGPAAVHIACTRLTLQVVETFTSDLNAFVAEARNAPVKLSRRDIGAAIALRRDGGTTCSATLIFAAAVGIKVHKIPIVVTVLYLITCV